MPGPVAKRSEARRRRNKVDGGVIKVNLDEAIHREIEIPAPPTRETVDEDTGEVTIKSLWHPYVERAYLSLAESGQAIFYEPSDWNTAYLACEAFSRELQPKPIILTDSDGGTYVEMTVSPVNGAVMNAFLKAWESMMPTEGARRRLHIELDRQKRIDAALGEDGVVVDITKNRADLFKAASRG
jgi:hypothetical protein